MFVLSLIVFVAFLTEAIVGFGAAVLTVTLGAHQMGIEPMLARFLPLNLLLSLVLLLRARKLVHKRILLCFLLPPLGAGLVLGMLLARFQGGPWLRILFGFFVVFLSMSELARLGTKPRICSPPHPWLDQVMLVLGGIIHGLFGSGGPMIVYVLSRRVPERGAMRATLAALWVLLNALLLSSFLAQGQLSAATLSDSVLLLPSLVLGLWLGEYLHHRLPELPFRRLVYVVLLLAGGALVLRALLWG
ncbi:MAG: TSUP family transporter [Myxococcales bacterium]|nr:TSUP family transporter [Polyangiaceae bacterium]MDW8248140.1 TSUP family transporter [Myxococcales bacterium]